VKRKSWKAEHDLLKEIAKHYLRTFGFREDEIFTEYPVKIKGYYHDNVRVDVAGVNKKKKVAIECGNTPRRKLICLTLVFDEVYHLPYPRLIHYDKRHGKEFFRLIERSRSGSG